MVKREPAEGCRRCAICSTWDADRFCNTNKHVPWTAANTPQSGCTDMCESSTHLALASVKRRVQLACHHCAGGLQLLLVGNLALKQEVCCAGQPL